jgi:Zn-dependent M28 family amino/carboxypeptidase
LDRAAEYIVGVFSALELRAIPAAPEFKQSFRCGRVEGVHSANVIATLPGADPALADEAVLVTAHYDHIGTKHDATGEDHIYNGANDNAAGTAAMLGVAAALTALPQPPRRSVVFIAFCGEELGLLGSKYYVEHPLFELPKTIAVVNLEMLGRPLPESPPVAWVTGAELSDLIESFPRPDEGSGVKFVPSSTIGWQEAAAFGRSDNAAFADQDVVAHTISTGKIDAYYHSVDDEPEVLDFERMALIVRALTLGVHRLADAPTRPAWTEIGQAAGYGD